VVNAKCDTRSPIIASFQPPRPANAIDPHNQPRCKRQYCWKGAEFVERRLQVEFVERRLQVQRCATLASNRSLLTSAAASWEWPC
jgi:hypothetical protein